MIVFPCGWWEREARIGRPIAEASTAWGMADVVAKPANKGMYQLTIRWRGEDIGIDVADLGTLV